MHEVFEAQTERSPDAAALVFDTKRLSYRELDARANQVAFALRAMGVGAESRVGLCLDRSFEMVVALLGILKAGGAYVPLDPTYPPRRLAFMASDAGLAALVTRQAHRSALPNPSAPVLCFDADRDWLSRQSEARLALGTPARGLAYVMYTSGSTGAPKGVLVERGGLTLLARTQPALFDVRPDSRILQFASLSFDISVSEFLMAFATGASLHLATSAELLPGRELVALLRERRITHAALPPSALAALPDAALPDLRVVVSVGEACSAAIVARWAPGRRFFNAYGPTEATVHATVHECEVSSQDPPIGRPLPGVIVKILGADGAPVQPGQVGEIHLGGIVVARGYHGQPELTEARFVADPEAPAARLYRTGDLGRTRDDGVLEYFGRRDHQVKVRGHRVELGEIESALRQIPSVRGAAVSMREDKPGDRRLVAYLSFDPGARAGIPEVRRFLGERLPEYMIPSHFVVLGALPLTPNGKIDRNALPAVTDARPAVSADLVAPRTADERALAEIWADVLRVRPVGACDDFFELGGDSLLAARIVARVMDVMGVDLSIRDIFTSRAIDPLARRVAEIRGGGEGPSALPLERASREAMLPLSPAELRLWFLHELDPEGRGYVLPFAIRLQGSFFEAEIGDCLREIVSRHEGLRTTYIDAGRGPSRKIGFVPSTLLAVTDLSALPEGEREATLAAELSRAAAERFDLRHGPLFRARLFRLGDRAGVLFVSMHHIVADGRSIAVLVEELAGLLDARRGAGGQTSKPLLIDYADFAAWQRRRLALGVFEKDISYFREELADAPSRSGLPAGRGGASSTRQALRCRFRLSPSLVDALRTLGRAEGASLFMVLMTGFIACLHRWTLQDDILIGTPTAGRTRPEFEGIFGFFANTLVLRSRLDRSPTLRALLVEVRERALGALAHAELPFEKLVEVLAPERLAGQNPFFQVMFALQAPLAEVTTAGGLRLSSSELDPGESPFDLLCQVWEANGEGAGLEGEFVHRVAVVEAAEVERLVEDYQATLSALVSSPNAPILPSVRIETIQDPLPRLHLEDLLPSAKPLRRREGKARAALHDAGIAAERPLSIAEGAPLVFPPHSARTLPEALVQAASGHGAMTCVEADGRTEMILYHDLLGEARVLLGGLRARGLGAGDRVILQMDSLCGHFSAFWACLLGGLVPVTVALAPSYETPSAATAKLFNTWSLLGRPALLTSRRMAGPLAALRGLHPMEEFEIVAIEDLPRNAPVFDLPESRPEDVAFLQLSSGSTGIPKCVKETHRGVIAHVHASSLHNGYSPGDVSLNWLPVDHVVPMLTLHLRDVCLGTSQIQVATSWILGDVLRWLDLLAAHRVTQTWAPNFGFKLIAEKLSEGASSARHWDLSALHQLLNGGEQVTLPVVRDFLRLTEPFGVRASAMRPGFGMAESATIITMNQRFDIETGSRWREGAVMPFVDLGPPLPGVSIRIADTENRIVSEGVIGRLQIKGDVVTPGYLDNDEANREAFVGEGWFDSGDLGFLEGGHLYVTGREKEMIIVRGVNLPCHEVEEIAGSVSGVEPTFVAAVAIDDFSGGTEGLAVFFVPRAPSVEAWSRSASEIRRAVGARLGVAPALVVPVERADFPKTTSGKVQRTALRRGLEEGRFRVTIRAMDLHEGNASTIPRWFFRRAWQQNEAAPRIDEPNPRACLIFADRAGLAADLRVALEKAGKRAVIAADDVEIEALDLSSFGEIVHLEAEPGEEAGRFLCLARALGQWRKNISLLWVSRGAQPVLEGEPIEPERAVTIGLLQTAAQEMPWLDARHVDIGAALNEAAAAAIVRELGYSRGDREVAYRDGARLTPFLEDAAPTLLAKVEPAFEFVKGGVYLVTGGLGGIGMLLARWLLENVGARLLLIGRSPAAAHAEALEALEALARASRADEGGAGEVLYEAVDVADAAGVAGAVERVEARWGRTIDAVIHLAATARECLLVDETEDGLQSVVRPRVEGARAVAMLLASRPDTAFVAFSSACGSFGGTAVGAYAAASRFIEHFTIELRRSGHTRSHCCSFSFWDGVGMSRDPSARQAAIASGYLPISPREGIASLRAALRGGEAHLLVGVDAANGQIRRPARAPRESSIAQHEAPRGEVEQAIAAIWQRALDVDRVGVNDNFFDVGGHSLLLAEVRGELERYLAREIPMTDLFRYPTIRAFVTSLGAPQAKLVAGSVERGQRQRAALGKPRVVGKKPHG